MGLICSTVFAGLEWDAHRINHTAAITDTKAEAAFTFTNTGDQPVTITSVRTSCGCTTTTLDKKIYVPGETGEVIAVFAFGDRTGRQHKRITVRTSEPSDDGKPIVEDIPLYLRVTIPQPIKVRPRMIYWKPDEPHGPKRVGITIKHDGPVTITNAQVEGDAVTTELKTIVEGKQYELIITPVSAEAISTQAPPKSQEAGAEVETDAVTPVLPEKRAVVSFQAEFTDDVTRTYSVMVRVMQSLADEAGGLELSQASGPLTVTPAANSSTQPVAVKLLGLPEASDQPGIKPDAAPADQH